MTQSIKQRINKTTIGTLAQLELRDLLVAIQSDLANVKTSLTTLQSDGNNTTAAVSNIIKAINNIATNCTGSGANLNNFQNNLGNVTFGNATPSALNLTT